MLLNKDKSGDTSRVLKASRKDVYEFATGQSAAGQDCKEYHEQILTALRDDDPLVYELMVKEYERARNSLQLIAAENQCSQAVLAALGSVIQNKTTEGFPGSRFHGGSNVVDDIERLAAGRAREAFGAKYANVQPHSGTQANQIVLTAILERDEKILSLGLDQGGHLSHGAKFSFSGKFFDTENYYVEPDSFLLDYQAIRKKALQFRPKLIICGATAYARVIDFQRFRQIADEVEAYLLADISHISGLVIAGAHPSPVNYAHFTTTSTYKPGGSRGGLILMGKDYDSSEKTTFPGVQGTPYLNNIAAKAVFFQETLTEQYRTRQFKIIENAKRLAESLMNLGFDVLTGGTDNHMVLVNVANFRDGLTGLIAQQCLEDCGIIVNKNKLPYDSQNAMITSGIRLGTPIVTKRGMGQAQMDCIAEMIDSVLRQIQIHSESQYDIDKSFKAQMTEKVKTLCNSYAVM
jgi:glycine hydroxymethyltransferase